MNPGFKEVNTLLTQSNGEKQALISKLENLSNAGIKAVKISDAKD